MLEKKITFDHFVGELGHIRIRKITRGMENGKEFAKEYHSHVVSPGDDYSNEDERTKKIAQVVHTAKVIKDYKDMMKEQEKEMEKHG